MFFFLSPDKTDENPREGEQFSLELGHDGLPPEQSIKRNKTLFLNFFVLKSKRGGFFLQKKDQYGFKFFYF